MVDVEAEKSLQKYQIWWNRCLIEMSNFMSPFSTEIGFQGSLLRDIPFQSQRIIFWCSAEPFLLWLYSNYGSFPEPDGIVYCTKNFPVSPAKKTERGTRRRGAGRNLICLDKHNMHPRTDVENLLHIESIWKNADLVNIQLVRVSSSTSTYSWLHVWGHIPPNRIKGGRKKDITNKCPNESATWNRPKKEERENKTLSVFKSVY